MKNMKQPFFLDASAKLLFDFLSVDVQVWKNIRDESNTLKTWQLVYINRASLKNWGLSSEQEITGKTADEIFGLGTTAHYMPIVQKTMEQGKPQRYNDYVPNLNKYFRFTLIPVDDYFIATSDDMTDLIDPDSKSGLHGIIPICCYCNDIRNTQGEWSSLEDYITHHTNARFSHGICPKCMASVQYTERMD